MGEAGEASSQGISKGSVGRRACKGSQLLRHGVVKTTLALTLINLDGGTYQPHDFEEITYPS